MRSLNMLDSRHAPAIALILILFFASIVYPLHLQNASALSFYPPTNLSEDALTPSSPYVAAAGDDVYVVWSDDPGTTVQDIFIRKSANNGTSFEPAVNISNNAGISLNPQVAVTGDSVFVVWEDDTDDPGAFDIVIARSTNGEPFDTPVNLSSSLGDASNSAKIAVSGSNVYVVWQEGSDIFLSFSINGGDTFSLPANISNTANAFIPGIAASGSNAYVIWYNGIDILRLVIADNGASFGTADSINADINSPSGLQVAASGSDVYIVWEDGGDIFLARSLDNGDSFEAAENITNNDGFSFSPHIVASGSEVNIVWEDDTGNPTPSTSNIFFMASTNSGESFSAAVNISDVNVIAVSSKAAVSGSFIYVVWQNDPFNEPNVFFGVIEDRGTPTITIEDVSNHSPIWGDTVEVSGTANADIGDTITIDWGDGSSTPDVDVTDGEWSETHEYDSTAVGENEIVARLMDESDTERAASDPEIVDVQKHETTITIDTILSVTKGSDITAEGTLTDADTSDPLDGMTITFTGTGAGNLADKTTSSGSYSQTGASPGTASALLTVQAHFAGDGAYEASDSDIISYDTVEPGADSFVVDAGAPSGPITLTGYDASILFDDVPAAGSIFVSACDSPASDRYSELDSDTCIQISPVVEMTDSTQAHITVSFAGKTLPDGHTEDEISIFRETVSGIVDITESRDLDAETVTGATSGFSRFIVAVALHEEAPENTAREQLFVGDNDVTFEFTETREIALEGHRVFLNSFVMLTARDEIANLDVLTVDNINATVTSTSDPTGITVKMDETGANTGVFRGQFYLARDDPSDNDDDVLHASNSDNIQATYEAATRDPFRLVLEDVTEAGIAQLVDYHPPNSITPVDVAYELSLEDAEFEGSITVVMSYTHAKLREGDDPAQLRILRMNDLGSECVEAPASTIDDDAKTVTASPAELGKYALAFPGAPAPLTCPGGGGGGGGGLPRPGSGLVLDAVAEAVRRSSGGHGSSTLTTNTSATSTDTNEVTLDAGGATIHLTFENAQNEDELFAQTQELSDIADLFTEVDDDQGHGEVGGSDFTTAGTVFEIDASNVDYEGNIQITIPYDESLISDEDDVRFLHYGEDGWEDATIGIDTEDNTVTGQVTSLSPVVAGQVSDGTYGEAYFKAHPTKRMLVTDDSPDELVLASSGQTAFHATVKNLQRANQTYAFITQVLDENGYTQSITWQTGTLGRGGSVTLSSSWSGPDGEYIVRMFVWTDVSTPVALSDVSSRAFTVG